MTSWPISGWPAAATLAGILLTLLVPPGLLDILGLGYSTPIGAPWEKVHPGSDLILLGLAGAALQSGTPLAWVRSAIGRFPGMVVFLATTTFLIVYIITVQQAPFTPLIDTFLVPALLLPVLVDLDENWKDRLEALLHGFVAINAVLGIVEYVSGWRLIPLEIADGSGVTEAETRAVGFLGHPLASAAMAGLYAVVLMTGGGRRLPEGWRLPALGLQLVALAAFGGRTALVMTLLCLAVTSFVWTLRFLAGRQIDIRVAGLALLVVPLAVAALAALANSGFFDVILDRFVDDNGSAKARGIIFDLFAFMSWQDLLFGPARDYLDSLQHLLGIEVGIESFWLGFLFFYGVFPSFIFFVGLAGFTAEIMRRTRPLAWVSLAFFISIISTSISLSAKTTMLGQFVTVLLILMPRGAAQATWRMPDVQRGWAVS
ncbi:VpsF family polysaccharide biosynthesis protein [Lichenifustis flavocetrariae]|uniref:VpsF family polysaccharide biosynthesis protein n=1 Tax=Lichenifustis flavocetrariae TaxID=2949735 RepID=A0AA41YU47_9HYPH|nr:VpsF family polysaccharide biosynthesis protein [Lichenifustis flavocetrariae]MCW6508616.1 VpsF family polysaccharide biosynthesis protein [Lichenifustis flavocetrariae]